ncbi:TIGR03089 family protein [Enemella sp. A6]|uniref:TIGR03089 family protein n=1 Tax=Enemella sp. A6 TaxID=3440152 RepID=UPI003EBDDF14
MSYHRRFEERLRHDASAPLLTWYDLDTGARVELSATTFGNWVDKTGHLLAEEADIEDGDLVAIPLAAERPGHWMTLVLVAACWHLGAAVSHRDDDRARLVIGGPAVEADPAGRPAWAVSLHPLGVGLGNTGPGVLDWADEVRGYPDLHVPPVDDETGEAWVDPPVTFAELTSESDEAARRLIRAGEPWPTVRAGLVTPILTGGSAVMVEGTAADERLSAIAADEHARL